MNEKTKSILIVAIGAVLSAFFITIMCFGIKLIIEGWQVVEEMGELLLAK